MGGDGASCSGHGSRIGGPGSGFAGSGHGRSCRRRSAGIGQTLALVGAVLPARAANGATRDLARASGRSTSSATATSSGFGRATPIARVGAGEGFCLGPCGCIHGPGTGYWISGKKLNGSQGREASTTRNLVVVGGTHLVSGAAVLVFLAAVRCAVGVLQKSIAQGIVNGVFWKWIGEYRLYYQADRDNQYYRSCKDRDGCATPWL